MIWFGPAGSSDSFAAQGYKSTTQAPEYLEKMGLNAYEYQCGHGVRVNPKSAQKLREEAEARGIRLSLHSPYYISLSSVEKEKRDSSIQYILASARAAKMMGAGRVVVHSGSCSKLSRGEALELAKDTLARALTAMDEEGLEDITICPETMGKLNQLGTLEEVLELCGADPRLLPCVDFGHLNARTMGGLRERADVEAVFTAMADKLGADRAKLFHAHFSKIEYTQNGGEKRHLTFTDTVYGPDFEPVAEMIFKYGCSPVIICESAGTQAEDAAAMRDIYRSVAKNTGG